ncbi:MAG: hypothetical protein HYY16_08700 [Planctomycetes bacterium]|nr:hypothetical protein [Planctomycetota bacterium]
MKPAARRRIARRIFWALGGPFSLLLLSQPRLVFGTPAPTGRATPDNGYYRDPANKHSDTATGVLRDAALPRGSCSQCHLQHETASPNDFALFTTNDNTLCSTCHSGTFQQAWPGSGIYDASGHGTSNSPYDPSTGAGSGRAAKLCVQCHNPHGNGSTSNGFYASLQDYLEENTCFSNNSSGTAGNGCHGSNATYRPAGSGNYATGVPNIYTSITTYASRHPLTLGDPSATRRHRSTESQVVNSGDFSGVNRHVECADCHNPHRAIYAWQDVAASYGAFHVSHASPGNAPGGPLRGAWGVQPTFGAAWTTPMAFTPQTFTGLPGEKESWVCYKCHSYFAYGPTPPAGQTDVAREFNTANLSHHPVEGTIALNNYTIATATNGGVETMEPPWQTGAVHKTMTCSDCHRSDTLTDPAGPHGSSVSGVLRAATGTTYATLNNAFCLQCHKQTVYQPAADPGATETGSRWDRQTTGSGNHSHYNHVVSRSKSCRNCHAGESLADGTGLGDVADDAPEAGSAHGTNLNPTFMSGVNIQTYTWPNGAAGSCDPECHASQGLPAAPK